MAECLDGDVFLLDCWMVLMKERDDGWMDGWKDGEAAGWKVTRGGVKNRVGLAVAAARIRILQDDPLPAALP